MSEPIPVRYWPHEQTAAARLLDMYAPIASQQPGLQNIIEWQRRAEMTEMVRAIEAEAIERMAERHHPGRAATCLHLKDEDRA